MERGTWWWDFDWCFFNLYNAASFPGACGGFANVDAYVAAYAALFRRPWNGTYPAFTRVFVWVDLPKVMNNQAAVRKTLRAAHLAGLKLEYLHDGTAWVKSAAGVEAGIAQCQQIAWFNGNATDPRDLWDGVHYDIEPHTLGSGWTSNSGNGTDRYNDAWERNLMQIFSGCRRLFLGTKVTVAWDVSDDYYYYVTDLWAPLLSAPYVDYIAVMTYYASSDAFLNGLEGVGGVAAVLASLQGRVPVLFAIETSDPRLAPDDVSLWRNGTIAAEAMLHSAATMYYGTTASFWGVAIHHWYAYMVLPPLGYGSASTALVTACATSGAFLAAVANSTAYVSIKVWNQSSATTPMLATDVSGYIPGPWIQPMAATAGAAQAPYRIELFEAPGAGNAPSPVGRALCELMA